MPDDRVDPRDEAAVRRLLAQARHDEPIPSAVASRLDEALRGIGVESIDPVDPVETVHRADDERSAPAVITTFSRTRRRRAATLVLAAAAVVLIGVGISQYEQPGVSESSSGSADSATEGQDRSRQVDRGGEADSGAQAPAPSAAGPRAEDLVEPPGDALSRLQLRQSPPTVRAERFGRDVREVRRRVEGNSSTTGGSRRAPRLSLSACADVPLGAGQAVAVRYAQAPAVLVLRPPRGQSQVVDLLSCADGAVTRSVTLPAR